MFEVNMGTRGVNLAKVKKMYHKLRVANERNNSFFPLNK